MLFNSFAFLLVFLPLTLAAHAAVERYQPAYRLLFLTLISIAFYGYWEWRFVPMLALSILLNWLVARAFQKSRRQGTEKGWIIITATALNLLALGFFKYTGFLVDALNNLGAASLIRPEIALPLGISFFTFHHVMYLTDLKAGRAPEYDLNRYALYIGFFPQVLAGPLVRWSEIMDQFDQRPFRGGWEERAARGIMLLTLGLAKKVLIGDPLAEYVNPVFAAAAAGNPITVFEAWQAVLGFAFQIYFDFSGYTDMALGIALLFGIMLPQNFDSPYRATSLQDFWRRWHMTLSRFLRDYLYIPLGGSRKGLAIQLLALLATMALGGLWHGADWTFVAWGVAHGLGLCAGVLWRRGNLPFPPLLGWLLTFLFVILCWVLFRATSFTAALAIYKAMLGFAPLGTGFKWRALAVAAAFAMIGPTSWNLAHKIPLSRWAAWLFALLFVAILLKIGDDANYEFIYFQF
ncbi:MAG: MBOAT family protein [Methylocystis sp.]|nr:MBOAT family protein [Methylocystis sp.]MCA3583398.1 MBOAT family protein [Methylocystis sp.]MCA3591917.1 MBOAT family protein [Methylocystis sp.]